MDQDTAPQPAAGQKSNRTMLIVLGGSLLLLALLAATWFFMGHKSDPATAEGSGTHPSTGDKGRDATATNSGTGPIITFDPFIVNLADTETRYLKLTLKIEAPNPLVEEEVKQRMFQIRDGILTILMTKTANALRAVEERQRLKDELFARVNGTLHNGPVNNVYFSEFVIQ